MYIYTYIQNTQTINISEASDVHKGYKENKFQEAADKKRSNTNFSVK